MCPSLSRSRSCSCSLARSLFKRPYWLSQTLSLSFYPFHFSVSVSLSLSVCFPLFLFLSLPPFFPHPLARSLSRLLALYRSLSLSSSLSLSVSHIYISLIPIQIILIGMTRLVILYCQIQHNKMTLLIQVLVRKLIQYRTKKIKKTGKRQIPRD